MPKKNEMATLEITGITHEGSGIGRLDCGMAVFVPDAAQGDRLLVRLVKINKNHAFGRIEEILSPSPHRILSDCPVSKRCGGCVFRHVSYAAELGYKADFVKQNLQRIGKIQLELEPILPSPQQEGYRNKAQYPIRIQKNALCAGFFAPRSHEVVDCHQCRLQPDSFTRILETVLDFVRRYEISVYDEITGTGLLRHVYLRQGARSGELMVCLVVNGAALPQSKALVDALLACEAGVVSVLLNENTRNTNVILGDTNHILYGKAAIHDVLCGVTVAISPLAFYQVNSPAAEQLYGVAAAYAALTGTETVLDLYCGAGTIGLSLAHQCAQVIGVEVIPQAVENAKANAAANGIENARFFCGDAAEAAARLAREGIAPDVVILDPPRKGCEESVLRTVAGMCPRRIVMVSCDSATLARDCALLVTLGYLAQRCRPVDLFPRTAHVEAVMVMTRCGDGDKK